MNPHQEERFQTKVSAGTVKIVGSIIGVTCPPFILAPLRELFLHDVWVAGIPLALIGALSMGTAANFLRMSESRQERVRVFIDLLFPCVIIFIIWAFIAEAVMK